MGDQVKNLHDLCKGEHHNGDLVGRVYPHLTKLFQRCSASTSSQKPSTGLLLLVRCPSWPNVIVSSVHNVCTRVDSDLREGPLIGRVSHYLHTRCTHIGGLQMLIMWICCYLNIHMSWYWSEQAILQFFLDYGEVMLHDCDPSLHTFFRSCLSR